METNKLREFRDELMKGKEIGVEHDAVLAKKAELKRVVAPTFRSGRVPVGPTKGHGFPREL
jgi:hypothetical protein